MNKTPMPYQPTAADHSALQQWNKESWERAQQMLSHSSDLCVKCGKHVETLEGAISHDGQLWHQWCEELVMATDNEIQRVQQLTPEQRAELCTVRNFAHDDAGQPWLTLKRDIAQAIREAEQAARQEEREAIAKLIRFMGSRDYVGDGNPADAEELALSVQTGKRAPEIRASNEPA